MDGFELAASLFTDYVKLVSALVWPMTVIVIVVMLRKPLLARISDLLKLDLPGGLKMEFAAKLREVKEEAISAEPVIEEGLNAQDGTDAIVIQGHPPTVTQTTTAPDIEDADALSANPTGTVMEAWKSLERTLWASVNKSDQTSLRRTPRGVQQLFAELESMGFLDANEKDVLKGLLRLRNMAAHSEEKISSKDAIEFMRIAKSYEAIYRKKQLAGQ